MNQNRKWKKFKRTTTAVVSVAALGVSSFNVFAAKGVEITDSAQLSEKVKEFQQNTVGTQTYKDWLNNVWTDREAKDSGKAALTPGEQEDDLNFAWYAQTKGVPAVKVWEDGKETAAKCVTGEARDDFGNERSNLGGNVYTVANHVEVKDYFKANTLYHYQYTDNYTGDDTQWSKVEDYRVADKENYSVIVTGDPQIGASGNRDMDTYNWDLTMKNAMEKDKDAAFLLSAGDQINQSGTSDSAKKERESEYAGYLYPSAFRSLPVATTVGNHDKDVDDYTMHFNNPNSEKNLGATAAGGGYYFSYGDVLYISLNSNNRNQGEHRELMQDAVNSHPDAKWKIVIFHSDIYGSGEPHADTDATANRIILAPLMDEFDIDVCITGHDHTYSRSYQIKDGTVIDYNTEENGGVVNPDGTLYITTGSGSGSKYYKLLNYTPYYIADRANDTLPAYSIMDFTDDSMTISTYDYNGEEYAEEFTITKSDDTVEQVMQKAEAVNTEGHSQDLVEKFTKAHEKLQTLYSEYQDDMKALITPEDPAEALIADNYGTENDPIKGYGSVANSEDKDNGANRLKPGYSTLLDKTVYQDKNFIEGNNRTELAAKENVVVVRTEEMTAAKNDLIQAMAALETEKTDISTAVLEYAIELAGTADTEGVIESVKAAFDSALENAQNVLKAVQNQDPKITQADVDAAWQNLISAMQYLEFKQGDKTDLEKVLVMAREMNENMDAYLDSGKAAFTAALTKAESVKANGDAMQTEVDQAWKELLSAMANMMLKPDKGALETLVLEAEALSEEHYEAEGFAVMRTALSEAKAVLENEQATAEEVQTAQTKLQNQMEALVVKAETSGTEDKSETQKADGDQVQQANAGDTANTANNADTAKKSVKTGDDADMMMPTAGILTVMAAAVAALAKKRK